MLWEEEELGVAKHKCHTGEDQVGKTERAGVQCLEQKGGAHRVAEEVAQQVSLKSKLAREHSGSKAAHPEQP